MMLLRRVIFALSGHRVDKTVMKVNREVYGQEERASRGSSTQQVLLAYHLNLLTKCLTRSPRSARTALRSGMIYGVKVT